MTPYRFPLEIHRQRPDIVVDAAGESLAMAEPTTAILLAASVNNMVEAMAEELDNYDGPEYRFPEWYTDMHEILGDFLSPRGDAQSRHEAVDALLWRVSKMGLIR